MAGMPAAVGMLGNGTFGIAMPGVATCGGGPRGGGGGTAFEVKFKPGRTGGGPRGSGGRSDESGMVGEYIYIYIFVSVVSLKIQVCKFAS